MRARTLGAAALGLLLLLASALPAAAQAPLNVARGRSYTLDPAPNYPQCTEPGDATQLTDGFVTSANFWTERTTVGWQNRSPVTITIDLGAVTSVSGASFHTAAGKAGVEWPAAIYVLASDDGKSFFPLGDLVALSNAANGPPGPGYRIHTYVTHALHGHGRYLRFIVSPTGPFVFVDEIEVYAGPPEWTKESARGAAVGDTREFFAQALVQRRVVAALQRDLALARQRVAAAGARGESAAWNAALARFDGEIASLPPIDPKTFRAVLPMGPVHAAIFALVGSVDAASGQTPLAAWRANPWDFLSPLDAPPPAPAVSGELTLLRGEARPVAVNVRNASSEPVKLAASVAGLGDSGVVRAAEVAFTETQAGIAVAAALPDAPRDGSAFSISVPAGMTRQIWLSIQAGALPPGRHDASITVRAPGGEPITLPLPLRIVNEVFPAQTRLHVGGWDYTNTDTLYGLTPTNVAPLITHLRSRGVDSPWATSAALPFGSFDGSGQMTAPPDVANFDRWLTRWPGARRYMVFLDVPDRIGSLATGDPGFSRAVAAWLGFWTAHAGKRGVKPDQIHLLLVDEPHDAAGTARILPWARAIRRAGAGVRVWEDPTFLPPEPIPAELADAVDVLCVDRTLGRSNGAAFWSAAAALRSPTRRLEIYDANGPTRTFDPYTYYRLQAWQAFAIGADGSSFWAFADDGGVSSWNELAGTQKSFTPLFLADDSVTAGKHMEAWVESAHDFEVLSLLADAVARAGDDGGPVAEQARSLLREGPARVLGAAGASDIAWPDPKNRSEADAVRDEAAVLLERLEGRAAP